MVAEYNSAHTERFQGALTIEQNENMAEINIKLKLRCDMMHQTTI